MTVQPIQLTIVVVYLIGMLSVGFLVNKLKIKTSTDYLVAGRRMGLFFVAASLSANNVGGGSTTGLAARAFSGWGLSAVWYVLAASIAMIPLAFFAPKIRKTMAVTIPEVLQRRYGTVSATITAVLNIASLFCLTSSQVMASGAVVSSLTGIPLNVCILLAGLVVIIYTTMGGLMADTITDVVQYVVIFIGLAIATPFVISGAGGWQVIAETLPPVELDFAKVGWVTIVGLVFNYFCTFLSGPEMVSRFESADSEKTAKGASLLSGVMMAAIAFFPTLIGLAALAVNPGLDGGKGTTALTFATNQYAPPFIAGLLSAAIIAATMSSADSNLLCASTMFVKDIYQKFVKKDLADRTIIRVTRLSNVVICLCSMAIAFLNISLVTMNLFAFALRSAGPFAAYALGLACPKATKNTGIASIVVGSIAAVIWQILGEPFGVLAIVFGCFCGTAAFFITWAVEKSMGKAPAPSAYLSDEEVKRLEEEEAGPAR